MNRYKLPQRLRLITACLGIFVSVAWAGQTGKISGKVIDAASGDPLPGANILIEGTSLGAASDLEGYYFIINISPGTYTISSGMIGYQKMRVENVKVAVDRTTTMDFKLKQTVLDLGESITVVAERPLVQKDLTATASSVAAEEIQLMPVESVQDILQLQAGIIQDSKGDLHIRGGRTSEIAYMVDGVSVSDPYSGKIAVNINQEAIQEIKVISGTFNAEYGKVMSGVVEVVTKEPESRFQAGGSFYLGDYLSSDKTTFYNIDDLNPAAIYNAQIYLTGPAPVFGNKLSYYLSLRKYYNDGWLYGQRRYNPTDSSNFQSPDAIYEESSGDNQPVALNDNLQYFANAKLVYKLSLAIKLNYSFLGDLSELQYYDHLYKYNPDGHLSNHQYGYTHIVNWNHMLSPSAFYTFNLSQYYMNFKSHLYKDLEDPRYADPVLLRNREDVYSFLTGGTRMTHFERSTTVSTAKLDLTSQLTKMHQIKTGLEFKHNQIEVLSQLAYYNGVPGGGYFSVEDYFNFGINKHEPVEVAAYLQDKIELKNMTVNAGLRYDYFNSRGKVPTDLRDPSNEHQREKGYVDAATKQQFSPRIGIAFPISASGVVHTSYGHFFQIPPYEYLYVNPRFAVAPGGLSTRMGNANLEPQSTVIYEVGFQQELLNQIGIDVTGFYKDARNLLGANIYETYVLGDRYARYENLDYGNIRGITLSVNKRPTVADHLTVSFDYTYQTAEGNASDPDHEFYNKQSTPPKKSNIQVVPLNWDQQHTINLVLSYNNPKLFGVGLIGQFQSGLPYTPAIQSMETTFENSGRKPMNYNVDLRLFKQVRLGKMQNTIFLKVYNLFDRRNEITVYDDTGRAAYSLVSHYISERQGHVNSLEEWLKRPDYYSEPRKVVVGVDFEL